MTGSGTQADPYIISNATDLQAMENHLDAYYELGGDIDASDTSTWNGGAGFVPVGDDTNKFTGSFDGNGYEITELFIDRVATMYVGLFGYCGGAEIKDVGIVDCNITGADYIGALAASQYSTSTTNCYATGQLDHAASGTSGGLIGYLTTSTMTDCHSSVVFTQAPYTHGGLIGYIHSSNTITNCYATGNVQGAFTSGTIGGLIGYVYADNTIENCYATGQVRAEIEAGGLIGDCYAASNSITNCYSRGNVRAISSEGGLIGIVHLAATISNCYSTGEVSGVGSNTGGLIGSNAGTIINCFWDTETSGLATSDGGTGKTTKEMRTKATFANVGWDFYSVWGMCLGGSPDYPCLLDVTPTCSNIILAIVSTNPATNLTENHATLNLTLDNNGGEDCDCGFQWGGTNDYGLTTATESKTTDETYAVNLTNLSPGASYHFRAFARNSSGIVYGKDRIFVTKSRNISSAIPADLLMELLEV